MNDQTIDLDRLPPSTHAIADIKQFRAQHKRPPAAPGTNYFGTYPGRSLSKTMPSLASAADTGVSQLKTPLAHYASSKN
ncbi:MAG: hypothetical protein CMJ59_10720 [Planctomycetaceae bacterium]|nr:hypothetical protein [Planctomycetaceae bacterium]